MKRLRSSLLAIATLAAISGLFSIPASAYYHFIYYLSSGNAPAKFDLSALPGKTLWFFVSEAGPGTYAVNDNFPSVVSQVRQAVQVWNGVASSDLRVAFGGLENTATLQNTPAGDVVFEDLPPGLLGYGGPTTGTPVTPDNGSPWVPITRSTVHLNRNLAIAPGPSYGESFFMTVVHEMGHALGLQHTFTSATMSTATTRSTSVAHPLDDDDVAGISVLYPNASFGVTGSITGRITSAGSGVHLASVVAIRAGVGAISALTNPDGTYRIDGVTEGPYYVYAHPLPPDADIKGPWNADGTIASASGPTNTLFYPGTDVLDQATPISVLKGKTTSGIDIALASRPSVPLYDVSVYGYFNNNTVAVKPAYINFQTSGTRTVVAAGVGLGADGQAPGLKVQFAGGPAVVADGSLLPYQANGFTYVAFNLAFMIGASAGPQHLIFSTPDFIHVLPSAVRLTQQDPPAIQGITANTDGSVTITGTNLATGSAIYFDGLPASILSLNVKTGNAVVMPPVGVSGQTAIVTVYNPDGQNSQFVQSTSPFLYTYANSPATTITTINPSSLPAGSEALVDITGTGFNFTASQVSIGFGTSDVVVRRVFVLGPNHLLADVSVAPGAALSNPDVSVFNGFRMATLRAGFSVKARVSGLPATVPVLINALPGLTGSYAGAIVGLYGVNLAVPNATPVLTFNGEPATILYSSPAQINLQIPSDLPAGPVQMKLNNGALDAYPVEVNIDTQPAVITGIRNSNGSSVNASNSAIQGDILTISLSGFAPDGATIAPSRVLVSLGGVTHSALTVTQSAPGIYQVSFGVNANELVGRNQSLIVYLDGRSSYPATIPVATLSGSFTVTPSAGN